MFPIPDTILDSLPDPIILLDGNRKVVATNRSAQDLFGSDLEGLNLARALRHPAALEAVDAVIAGVSQREVEVTLPVPVQRDFSVQVVGFPEGDVHGTAPGQPPVRAVAVLHDLTLARRTEQMQADFVANVSHELRSPLSALVGIIETLRGPAADDTEARAHFLEIMQREADRMGRMINDLLSLSRVEVNEHVPPTGQVDIGEILGNVAELLAVPATEQGMEIEVICAEGLPAVVGDPDELTQVFQNLVDNAIKYTDTQEPIRIEAVRVDRVPDTGCDGIAVSVADRGVGIAKDDLPRLTERFYRIDKARSRGMGGTGLGLAIVKHIVKRHRGRLQIASELGAGTTVSVLLPACHKSVTDPS